MKNVSIPLESDLLFTLQDRGFIQDCTNLSGLDALVSKEKISAYIGFDLTADSLHVGSLIQIMILRWLKKFGHNPIVLFGEATTKIGDPSGKTTSRPMLTEAQIETNRQGILRVIDRLVGHSQQVTNKNWFHNDLRNDPLSYVEFLDTYGRHFTINRMLTFDSVKTRLTRNDPLTFLEFNYMLMQAVDFLKLNDRAECALQIGGSDQWGNIVNGVELIRRINSREAFGLTTPLLTNAAGEKMGKTASGAIWLDPDKTSAFEFWQFWRNVEDRKVGDFLRLFTELSMDEITTLECLGGKEINQAKIVLATEVTALVHGRATAEDAAKLGQDGCLGDTQQAMPTHEVRSSEFEKGVNLAQILFDAGLVKSKTEAGKIASNGGIKLNGLPILGVRDNLTSRDFGGDSFTLSVGKNKKISVQIVEVDDE